MGAAADGAGAGESTGAASSDATFFDDRVRETAFLAGDAALRGARLRAGAFPSAAPSARDLPDSDALASAKDSDSLIGKREISNHKDSDGKKRKGENGEDSTGSEIQIYWNFKSAQRNRTAFGNRASLNLKERKLAPGRGRKGGANSRSECVQGQRSLSRTPFRRKSFFTLETPSDGSLRPPRERRKVLCG